MKPLKPTLNFTLSANTWGSIVLFCLYTLFYVGSLIFHGPARIHEYLMGVGSLLLIFLLLSRIPALYYLTVLVFCLFAIGFGTLLNMYDIIPFFDIILHSLSGVLLVFFGNLVYEWLLSFHTRQTIPRVIRLSFCFLFSVAAAGLWEVWEFAGDMLFGLTSQRGAADTMTDIISGSLGAVAGVLLLWYLFSLSNKYTALHSPLASPSLHKGAGTHTIQTKRLVLRRFKLTDADSMLKNWAGDPDVQLEYAEPVYRSRLEVVKLIRAWKEMYSLPHFYRWTITLKGANKSIGQIAIYNVDLQNNWGEIEYCISSDYKNNGYVTEALQAVVDYAFMVANFHRIQISHRRKNQASARVIEKTAMIYEGTLREAAIFKGKFDDRVYYSMLREEYMRLHGKVKDD